MPDSVDSKCRPFADDSIIYREIKSPDDNKILQDDLIKLTSWEQKWGMSFIPSKCNIMHITRKRNPSKPVYFLKGEALEPLDSAKYLGVNITNDLSWNKHIDSISKKGNQTLGFIKRNIPKSSPTSTKDMAYKTLVRPQLEYASCVWDPYQQYLVHQLEMVQRRAARYALGFPLFSQDSVSNMLSILKWEELQQRRWKAKLIMTFKIKNGLVAIPPSYFLTSGYATRGNKESKYIHLGSSTDYYKFSFFPSVLPAWNSLDPAIANCSDLTSFKTSLESLHIRALSHY